MKRGFKLFLFLLLFLFFIPIVKADEDSSCYYLDNMMDGYATAVDQIESLECENLTDGTNDMELLGKCEDLYTKRNYYLSILFRENDKDTCPSNRLDEIIEANEEDCHRVLESSLKDFASNIMNIFFIIAPFLVIIFGSLDFTKIVVSTNPKDASKHRKNFIRRVIAMVLLYLTPGIVNIILSLSPDVIPLESNLYTCSKPYVFSAGTFETTYVQRVSTKKSTSSTPTYYSNYSTESGKAIAEAAKDIKEYVIANGYSWCGNSLSVEDQATDKTKCIVCATLVRTSLYRAGIYDKDEANSISNNSAPTVARNLIAKGWIPIWNAEDLQPGDVLLYQKLTNIGDCGQATIEGKKYYVPHVDIYYGDGKKVSTGDYPVMKSPAVVNFSTGLGSFSGGQGKWLCGLRYPGK